MQKLTGCWKDWCQVLIQRVMTEMLYFSLMKPTKIVYEFAEEMLYFCMLTTDLLCLSKRNTVFLNNDRTFFFPFFFALPSQKVLFFAFLPQGGTLWNVPPFSSYPVIFGLLLTVGHCVMSHLHLVIPLFVASFFLSPQKTTKPPFSIKSPPKESPFLDTKLVQKLLSIAKKNVEANQFSLLYINHYSVPPRAFSLSICTGKIAKWDRIVINI